MTCLESERTAPLLPFEAVEHARFLRREKRFLVECEADGRRFWAHTNNSGSMLGLLRPGSEVVLSRSDNPRRKLAHTLELIRPPQLDGAWVGVNTMTPNRLLKAAFAAGRLAFAEGYATFTSEARHGDSRIDAVLRDQGLPDLWVECKNVTLVEDEQALFPDAVTVRGQKHLRTLMDIVSQGGRAVLFFVVQRPDSRCFGPAEMIDSEYARLLSKAVQAGVEVWPVEAPVSPSGVDIGGRLPLAQGLDFV